MRFRRLIMYFSLLGSSLYPCPLLVTSIFIRVCYDRGLACPFLSHFSIAYPILLKPFSVFLPSLFSLLSFLILYMSLLLLSSSSAIILFSYLSLSHSLPPSLSFLPPLPPSYFSLFLVLPPFYFSLPLIFLFSYFSQSWQVYNPWAPDSRSFIYVTPAGMFHTPLVGSRHCLGDRKSVCRERVLMSV